VMEAFQRYYPDITIFLTFGYSFGGSLLNPFLDGMVDAANPEAMIVDGYEGAYHFREVSRFAQAYEDMSSNLLSVVADPERYLSTFSFGFGIWMDADWRSRGWHTDDFELNFYTPGDLKASVFTALTIADKYVWVYSEIPQWWTEEGTTRDLPVEYYRAIMKAKLRAIGPLPPDGERPLISELSVSPSGVIEGEGSMLLSAKVEDPQGAGDIKKVMADFMPPLNPDLEIELNDGGVEGDAAAGDGIYSCLLPRPGVNMRGDRRVAVMAEDNGGHWNTGGELTVRVVPAEEVIFGDHLGSDWTFRPVFVDVDSMYAGAVHGGSYSLRVVPTGSQGIFWIRSAEEYGYDTGGYESIEFYIKPDIPDQEIVLVIGSFNYDLREAEGGLNPDRWTRVTVRLDQLELTRLKLQYLMWTIKGGGICLDDIRLVPMARTSVEGESGRIDLPEGWHLGQNYPNPFNAATCISYSVPHPSRVRLTVYNVVGQRVAVLADGEMAPGRYRAFWDASGHASGIYLVQLSADGFTGSRKVVLIK